MTIDWPQVKIWISVAVLLYFFVIAEILIFRYTLVFWKLADKPTPEELRNIWRITYMATGLLMSRNQSLNVNPRVLKNQGLSVGPLPPSKERSKLPIALRRILAIISVLIISYLLLAITMISIGTILRLLRPDDFIDPNSI